MKLRQKVLVFGKLESDIGLKFFEMTNYTSCHWRNQ